MVEKRVMTKTAIYSLWRFRVYVLVAAVSVAATWFFVVPEWSLPQSVQSAYWNGIVAFAALALLCDTTFLRISFANVNSSVAFVPFLASVMLFGHPWPMLISGLTALVVDTFVRRKPAIKTWFNTAQYMVSIGAAGAVYTALGGEVSASDFSFRILPFSGLVITYFLVNS